MPYHIRLSWTSRKARSADYHRAIIVTASAPDWAGSAWARLAAIMPPGIREKLERTYIVQSRAAWQDIIVRAYSDTRRPVIDPVAAPAPQTDYSNQWTTIQTSQFWLNTNPADDE